MTLKKNIKYWLYNRCPGLAGSFPYYGTPVYFPRNSASFRAACEQGIFEAENIRLLQHLSEPNTTYFDIGANIGLMAIPILQHCPSCQVVSFDPSPNTLPFLQRTVASSPFKDRWLVIPKALSNKSEQAEFYLAAADMSFFDGLRNTQRVAISRSVTVEVSTLDYEWEKLGYPAVSVIKCDVEGNELSILKGATALLRRDRPSILFEWNKVNLAAYDCDPLEILSFSKDYNYQLYSLPNLIKVETMADLSLHMILTESFLLAPA